MKRFILSQGNDYYPGQGALGDYIGDFDTKEECLEALMSHIYKEWRRYFDGDSWLHDFFDTRWATILDLETGEEPWIEVDELLPLIEKYESKQDIPGKNQKK